MVLGTKTTQAFSLVELSIVLVILGLLTGGILAGQSLIRAAELRSVITDMARFQTATLSFRDKYFAYPGDMAIATRFWGDDNAACPDGATPNGSPGTCNGNGNGVLDLAAGVNLTGEEFQYWKQLMLAGLIEGSYSGLAGSGGTTHAVLGVNVPRARISSGGYSVASYTTPFVGHNSLFDGSYGQSIQFGGELAGLRTGAPIIKPEEAWNVDTKLDDGKPGLGFVVADKRDSPERPNCSTTNDSLAEYMLTNTSNTCRLILRNL